MSRFVLAARRADVWLLVLLLPALSRAGDVTVNGTVIEHLTGMPLDGVHVSIRYMAAPYTFVEIGAPITAADGRYAWTGSCPGTATGLCYIDIDDPRYVPAESTFDRDATEVVADFALLRPATIEGDIRIDGVAPEVPVGVRIEYQYSPELFLPAATTYQESAGHYSIGRIPPDVAYRLCTGGISADLLEQCYDGHDRESLATGPEWDPVVPSEDEHLNPVDFSLTRGGTIRGTIQDAYAGVPLAGSEIRLTLFDDSGIYLDEVTRTTGANGSYRISGLPDGDYYLQLRAGDVFADGTQVYPGLACTDDGCPPITGGQALHIDSGATLAAIDFTLHPDVVVSGKVVDADSGDGLGNVKVETSNALHTEAVTDAATGRYAFYASHHRAPFQVYTRGAQPHIDQVYPGIPCIDSACLSQGQTLGGSTGTVIDHIDFSLALGAAISGHVDVGIPAESIVTLYDADFHPIWSTTTDVDAQYASEAWIPGTYYASATTYVYNEFLCSFFDRRPCPEDGQDPGAVDPTPIQLALGEVQSGVDFHLLGEVVFKSGFEP